MNNKLSPTPVAMFFIVPTLMLLIGYLLFPYPNEPSQQPLVYVPLFLGLLLLGIGVVWREKNQGSYLKITGWVLFSFFWSLMPSFLYFSEGGDVFNATVCILGVYILIYVAYHEWLSLKQGSSVTCLNWIAGGTFIAGIIYFMMDGGIFPAARDWLIETVAAQSCWVLNAIGLDAYRVGDVIFFNSKAVGIIFACTAIQSMALFVGMIGALPRASIKRKTLALLATVVPIYFLNLIRNAGVVYLFGSGIVSFPVAHNIIGKIGSLIALIVLLFIAFKIAPELFDELMCFVDLPKRKGPVERVFLKILGKAP